MSPSFLIPILALIFGIGSLYFDPQSRTNEQLKLKKCLIIALLLICVFGIFDKRKDQNDITTRETRIESLLDILKKFRVETKTNFQAILAKLSSYGMLSPQTANVVQIQESLNAEKERGLLAKKETESRRRSVTVQYFPKDVDVEIVQKALTELGFKLKLGKTRLPKIPTNAIFFGDGINIDDAKLVAYTLIRAGVTIKLIQPFHNSKGRSNVIQVGSARDAVKDKPLTIDEIRNSNSFKVRY